MKIRISSRIIAIVLMLLFALAACSDNTKPIDKQPEDYEIIFLCEGEELAKFYLLDGEIIPKPDDPKKEDYVFSHWATHNHTIDGSEIYDFSAPVSTHAILFAHFIIDISSQSSPIEKKGLDFAIEELNGLYQGGDALEYKFKNASRATSGRLSATISYGEPYTGDDFPVLVESFVDNVVNSANKHGVYISDIHVKLMRDKYSKLMYYWAMTGADDNDALKIGHVVDNDREPIQGDINGGVMYNGILPYSEVVAANKDKLAEAIQITKISTSKPNIVDGIDANVSWRNNSEHTIKYITFFLTAYNAVGDKVSCEVRKESQYVLEGTGPFNNGTYTTSELGWYNKNIVKASLDRIYIVYMDDFPSFIMSSTGVNGEWIN